MNHDLFISQAPVTLAGGGVLGARALDLALGHGPRLFAADGGALGLRALGYRPEAIIGDLDSLGDRAGWLAEGVRIVEISEQDSTDFAKCVGAIRAPLILGVGFLAGRIDHVLATLSAMAARPDRPVLLVGEEDVCCLCPGEVAVDLAPGTRVSLWPLGETRVTECSGLVWDAAGLTLSPSGRVGTSNAASGGPVRLGFDRRLVLLVLPVSEIDRMVGLFSTPAG